jgi:hypothetical protein
MKHLRRFQGIAFSLAILLTVFNTLLDGMSPLLMAAAVTAGGFFGIEAFRLWTTKVCRKWAAWAGSGAAIALASFVYYLLKDGMTSPVIFMGIMRIAAALALIFEARYYSNSS